MTIQEETKTEPSTTSTTTNLTTLSGFRIINNALEDAIEQSIIFKEIIG
jgi:hypothetical protein